MATARIKGVRHHTQISSFLDLKTATTASDTIISLRFLMFLREENDRYKIWGEDKRKK